MRYLSKALPVLFGFALFWAPAPAHAAEVISSDVVLIREGVVVEDDVLATGLSVRVVGEIRGDLVAFAAEEIIIEGRVTGSVTGAAASVIITGTVEGSVRVSSPRVTVAGSIGDDLVATALTTRLEPGSQVGGDVLVWGWRLDSLGLIGEDLVGTQRNTSLAGSVAGDVAISVSRLTISDHLLVGGNLVYRSVREATNLELAEVEGTITRRTPMAPNIRVRALVWFGRGMTVLFLTIAAVTLTWGWPDRTDAAIRRVGSGPLRSWLLGAAVFLSPVLLAAGAFGMLTLAPAAAGLPLVAVLLPLLLALVGVLLLVSIVAGAPVAAWFGAKLFKRLGRVGAVLVGSMILGVVWMIPLVGFVVPLLVLPLGLGSWLRSGSGAVDAGAESAPA